MKRSDSFYSRFIDIEAHRYANLEGVRALAIFMVFNVHVFSLFSEKGYFVSEGFIQNIFKVFHAGHTGVDLFFVLSGFLIYRALGKAKNLGRFMLKRYHRLWPVVAFTCLLRFGTLNDSWKTVFDNFSLLMFWTKEPANLVNWTLTYEIYFYFFIGLWFFYLRKAKIMQNNGLFLFGFILILAFWVIPGHFIQEPYRFIAFFWGILLAKLFDHGHLKKGLGRVISEYGYIISFIGLTGLLTWWGIYGLKSALPDYSNTVIFYLLIQIAYFLLIVSLLKKDSVLTPLFSSRPMRYLGNISYSFYVVHWIWGIKSAEAITKHMPDSIWKLIATWILGFIFTTIIASLIFLWLEKPYFTGRSYFSNKIIRKKTH